MAKEELKAFIAKYGITAKYEFVPFSKSLRKSEKDPSLNYIVTILKDKSEILETPYSMGCGHAPSYRAMKHPFGKRSVDEDRNIKLECEGGVSRQGKPDLILPDLTDVLWSLGLDASVLNNSSFQDWAAELGYDSDSRKAEATYDACLRLALALRAALGQEALDELWECSQDY